MVTTAPPLERIVEERILFSTESPMDFEEYLDVFMWAEGHIELVNGVPVERMAANLFHEKLFSWLHTLLYTYVDDRNLGLVLGSRSAVKISQYGGRLPDILFIRQDQVDIAQQRAIYGPPDLVIELVSPGDRPSDLHALETDYRSVGVPEIWFVDPQKRRVRALRRREADYEVEKLSSGAVRSDSMPGFMVELAWLFDEPRPKPAEAIARMAPEP